MNHKRFGKKMDKWTVIQGNVTSPVQTSTFVRACSQMEVNGYDRPWGALRQYDLDYFRNYTIPFGFIKWLKENPDATTIIYAIREYVGDKRVVHGWVMTDEFHKVIGRTNDKYGIVDEFIARLK